MPAFGTALARSSVALLSVIACSESPLSGDRWDTDERSVAQPRVSFVPSSTAGGAGISAGSGGIPERGEPLGGAGAAALGGAGGLIGEGGTGEGGGGAPPIVEPTGGSAGLVGSAQGGGAQTALPPLCTRLADSVSLSKRVGLAYRQAVYSDCRVAMLIDQLSATELPRFAQRLFEFNLALWGCSAAPPLEYTLGHGAAHLTSADAEQLTLHYLNACSSYLQLGELEVQELKSQLDRLSESAIVERTSSFSLSLCDTGGASGAGGGGGVAGAGP